jgi:hypothetical protein
MTADPRTAQAAAEIRNMLQEFQPNTRLAILTTALALAAGEDAQLDTPETAAEFIVKHNNALKRVIQQIWEAAVKRQKEKVQ